MSLRLRGGKLWKSFPREFVTPVAETAIHSACPVSRSSFREYNTKRIPRDFAENVNGDINQKYPAIIVIFQAVLLSAFLRHI